MQIEKNIRLLSALFLDLLGLVEAQVHLLNVTIIAMQEFMFTSTPVVALLCADHRIPVPEHNNLVQVWEKSYLNSTGLPVHLHPTSDLSYIAQK